MADFLLVHGTCHAAWCWRDLIPELEALDHTARAIDMPSHGNDETPLTEVTLASCAGAILSASTPDTIIVGHSWGGYPISAAAETDPEAMRGLIYLCGYVPVSGLSMMDLRQRAPRQPVARAAILSADGKSMRVDLKQAAGLFYSDCSPEAVEYALANLGDQPLLPQTTPLTLTTRFHRVPKSYIRCTNDQTIPPEYQAHMVKDWPPDRVYEMATSHSPFLSAPKALADVLNKIAKVN